MSTYILFCDNTRVLMFYFLIQKQMRTESNPKRILSVLLIISLEIVQTGIILSHAHPQIIYYYNCIVSSVYVYLLQRLNGQEERLTGRRMNGQEEG